jgi:hypothetical protein
MLTLLPLLLQATAPAAAPPRDIVVTANRLEDTARALRECLARGCSPEDDARLTLAHAENQFVAGGYADARTTVQGSLNRIGRLAKQHPVAIGDLWRASARVNQHLGEAQLARVSAVESLQALKAGLPDDDGRVLVQRIEVADVDAKLRRADSALLQYDAVANDARRANLPTVEGFARLRRVVLLASMSQYDGGYLRDMRAGVRWFEGKPELAAYHRAAQLLTFQAEMKRAQPGEIDALIARYGRATEKPQLLFTPAATMQDSMRATNGGSATNRLAMDNVDDQWVDVSFWITPDGKVQDVDVLRQSPKLAGDWVRPITERIAGRRYAPLALAGGEPGLLRVERYTLTAHWLYDVTGTRIRQREAIPRIEMVDLTNEPAAAAVPAAAPKG